MEIEVTLDEAVGVRVLTVRKQRDLGTTGRKFAAKFVPFEIGFDQWGKPQTASVIESADAPLPGPRTPKVTGPKLSRHAKNALSIFDELFAAKAEVLAETSIAPRGVKGVKLDDWRARYYARFATETTDDPKEARNRREAKRKEFDRARDDLYAENILRANGVHAWRMGRTKPDA
ncbi:hypothetical protein [Paraburkholderia sp. CNPSo 3281]|uniref:hypothetical protein n=1 Tax=Paraburkholderia sp. CNPSo 3281 TaxID=2940933 RepID=UPI0020B63884|nr:hypothetical protein [Paraburkholderia sp. CNPSo 3281]MCP3719123.1 hypothetical protein [Paraburkholderia sp. CNPSo 3281]